MNQFAPGFKVHGQSHVINIEDGKSKSDEYRLQLEFASLNNAVADWSNKLIFQLTPSEHLELIGLFLGYLPDVRFDRSQGSSTKFCTFERKRQTPKYPGSILVKASESDQKMKIVPIPAFTTAVCSNLLITKYCTFHQAHPDVIIPSIRAAIALIDLPAKGATP